MKIFELIVIGFGLAMDAFAVAVCKGLSMEEMDYKNALVTGGFFGGFQALMPFVGYILCIQFSVYIKALDHWIAFILLFIIGIKKIKESRDNSCPMSEEAFSLKNMLVLSIATSIDALAIGITFALLKVNIYMAVTIIGIITFSTSCIGVKLGYDLGCKFKSKAEVLGGLILIVVGTKILLEHLGIMG
ncbi:manganese efflux pump MntP [Tepidimicrobium xylanilyticum]|uniref:Putative manganese efflux pump MntP n=1 Tax=Tepidimicrobium xylanilyticum TaxID=1123352 RepID=A0A1H2Z8M8_9FIRM|nr:manganese efflux pump MntP family protein [Tepidimicrobium xylanilyticum]SDX13760.1 Putative Mn2+ efflux pump MntP [Tepidimicrobium xylanilyticum]